MQTTSKFKELLDENYKWPCAYLFKFIVLEKQVEELLVFFQSHTVINKTEKPSSGGKYISVSIEVLIHSSDDVINLYENTKKIPGIISL